MSEHLRMTDAMVIDVSSVVLAQFFVIASRKLFITMGKAAVCLLDFVMTVGSCARPTLVAVDY